MAAVKVQRTLTELSLSKLINVAKGSTRNKTLFSLDAIMDKYHATIWPKTDEAMLAKLLEEDGTKYLNLKHGRMQETCLHRAAKFGNKKVVRLLLDKGASVSVKNVNGSTPLHLACESGHTDIAKMLIEAGASMTEKNLRGDEPSHCAAKAGSLDILEELYRLSIPLITKGFRGNTCLHYASQGGQYDLVAFMITHCSDSDPNITNNLLETPLHLAAAYYSRGKERPVRLVELLLDQGGNLNARTAWGDTAAHYAAMCGNFDVLTFLMEEGISVDKSEKDQVDNLEELLSQNSVTPDEAKSFRLSFLQKITKGGCIKKTTFVIDQIMKARVLVGINTYVSLTSPETSIEDACNFKMEELNDQQLQLFEMSDELKMTSDASKDNAISMMIRHCSEAVPHLLDSCLFNVSQVQAVGHTYLDMFIFSSLKHGNKDEVMQSELNLIGQLVMFGKARFLAHPLISVFLKLKWDTIKTFHIMYVLLFGLFFLSLTAYSLQEFGQIFGNEDKNTPGQGYAKVVWWNLLAVCHGCNVVVTVTKLSIMILLALKVTTRENFAALSFKEYIKGILFWLLPFFIRHILLSVLVGLVVYREALDLSLSWQRAFIATSIIIASNNFMMLVSRYPLFGGYIHMLSKVLLTVLRFFTVYSWHFIGYAVAFHILLPTTEAFSNFAISFTKVITMILGEYEYTANFIKNPESNWVSRIIFVVFVIDMSVVLMNLILGLAVSDIEALQRDSDVQRMLQEYREIAMIEDTLINLSKLMPCLKRFVKINVTSELTDSSKELWYLDLVDVDESPRNSIIRNNLVSGCVQKTPCPHSIVTETLRINRDRIAQAKDNGEPEVLKRAQDSNNKEISERLHELTLSVTSIKSQISVLCEKLVGKL